MLKLIWSPGAGAAPDQDRYKRAIDTLTASYGDQRAEAGFPRDGETPISGLAHWPA